MNSVFIQPADFLRSSAKTNPYFDPIIKCTGDDWSIWMPKGEKSGYPSVRVRYYGSILFWQTWFWRVVHVLCPWLPSWKVYYAFGRLARPFLREWGKADVIITITGLFADVLAGAFPDKRIVDIQHGVIYSKHSGYFNKDGSLIEAYRKFTNREFWLYGQGYADCFFKNPENEKWLGKFGDPSCRVKVIGDLLHASQPSTLNPQPSTVTRDVIAVSLQFTTDFGKDVLQTWADDLCKVFEQIEAAGLRKRFPVVMRHHPRFGNSFDMGPMMKRFPWLQLTDESTPELIARSVYHITYMSTSAFEYAAEGVPTLFTASEKNRVAVDMMYGEFGYPIPLEFQQMACALDDPKELSRQGELVKAWYRKFYAPFDAENCLKLLKGDA